MKYIISNNNNNFSGLTVGWIGPTITYTILFILNIYLTRSKKIFENLNFTVTKT